MLSSLSDSIAPSKVVKLTKSQAINIINTYDPIIGADYHLLKELVNRKNPEKYKKYVKHTAEMIKLHNATVKPNDWFLCLGDISEEELQGDDIDLLLKTIRGLTGKKILVKGNNDSMSDDFYYRAGFSYVTRGPLVVPRIVFSHEPVDLKFMKLDPSVVNIHGHLHESLKYRNIDPENHINTYYKLHNGRLLRVSEYMDRYTKGEFDNMGTRVTWPFYDQHQI